MDSQIISVVLAAGASTRMKSRTSKLLQPILGKPLIQWAYEQASAFDPEKIVFVLGHQRELIEPELKKISDNRIPVEIGFQREAKGTADAVKASLTKLEGVDSLRTHIFIMGGDAVLLSQESIDLAIKNHRQSKAILTVLTAEVDTPGALGRIVRGRDGSIERVVEFKDATEEQKQIREVNSGFYLVQLEALRENLGNIDSENKSQEFYLTDLVHLIREKGGLVRTQALVDSNEALGINTHAELAQVREILQDRINSTWMGLGVCIHDPKTTWIDASVTLKADVQLEPGVCLRGKSSLGAGVRVGAYSIVEDSSIGRFSVVHPFSHLSQAKVGEFCAIGPYGRLRPGAILHNKSKIGNFVEVKKSELKEGAKANHLAYIGDATVGEGSNIGAGTITCNYDGYRKSKTVLGKSVFVGSNTSLVAPVEIGDRAIIGAGSVVTESVSADSLAIERSEQKEIKDAAIRFREKWSK